MGRLIKGLKWATETFEKGSRPGLLKIIEWIESGEVPGRIILGEPYVDADSFALGYVPRSLSKPKLTPESLLH